ncbi:hypothetical protein LSAT2_015058 [Lamellibrachia satsuma]|nr:hypothetical protein LSAT2_015058 [Lamellibrachia satsuma]
MIQQGATTAAVKVGRAWADRRWSPADRFCDIKQTTVVQLLAAIFVALTLLARGSRGLLQEQTTDASWVNDPGGMLSRSCMYGFGIVSLRSIHDPATRDRSWFVQCGQVGDSSGQHHCRWTYDFVNRWQEPLNFQCDDNGYISGVYSDFNQQLGDRVFSLECCTSDNIRLDSCIDTDWANGFGGVLEFRLPPNKLLHGLYSYYSEEKR